jgi:hypothetical protein
LIPRRERQMVKQKVAFRRNSELKMLLWLFERTGNGVTRLHMLILEFV